MKLVWFNKGSLTTPYRSHLIPDPLISNPLTDLLNCYLSKMKNRDPFHMKKVFAICNQQLLNSFIGYRNALLEKWRSSDDLFLSTDWLTPDEVGQMRKAHYDVFHKHASSFPWNLTTNLPLVPMLHGTDRKTAWKIVQTGFATVCREDPGFYGTGIYFTSNIDYAKHYSYVAAKTQKLCLVLSLVVPGNIYPVTEHHKGPDSLLGKTVKGGHQSHYTNVHTTADHYKFGHVCNPPTGDVYDELVVFQDAQALPLFVIYC